LKSTPLELIKLLAVNLMRREREPFVKPVEAEEEEVAVDTP
jgi:hypothetical protein